MNCKGGDSVKKKKVIIILISVLIIIAGVVITALMYSENVLPVSLRNENTETVSESTVSEKTSLQASEITTSITTTASEKTTTSATMETTSETTTKSSINASGQLDFLCLINSENTLDKNYVPKLKTISSGQQVDERIYADLKQMIDDAKKAGYNPVVCSAYRSYDTQVKLYNRKVKQYKNNGYSQSEAEKLAGEWVAKPGTSEHQSGLAVDLVSKENQNLDDSQLDSKCQQWYMENCWKYGFILRYPSDKKSITKINSEPWHYRYVGKDAAKEIYDSSLCLEEYLAQSKNL